MWNVSFFNYTVRHVTEYVWRVQAKGIMLILLIVGNDIAKACGYYCTAGCFAAVW